jgi:prolyl-tRNA synthetase
MYLSNYFLPTLKENPKEASIASHRLMLRSGMIRQLSAGLYNWLPLGVNVLKKVERIVREEMNNSGSIEVVMPVIQPIDLWKKSGRFGMEGDLSSEMLKIEDRHGNMLTFAPTAEEVISDLFKNTAKSYKDLPKSLYQINWKFRDEIRPRFGVMRAREFLMKDAYSFDLDESSALERYEIMLKAYLKIYSRTGLIAIPVKADTGSMGGSYSHEFHVLADTGESTIFYEDNFLKYLKEENITLKGLDDFYANEEGKHIPNGCKVPLSKLQKKKGIELGHIFYLGDKYTKSMEVTLQDKEGKLFYPKMGCYGIGISRLVAAIIEANYDKDGIIWPEHVAPFLVGIINLKPGDTDCDTISQDIYDVLRANSIEVLLDDTEASVGVKCNQMELIGLPWCITVGPKNASVSRVELQYRRTKEKHDLTMEAAKEMLIKSLGAFI